MSKQVQFLVHIHGSSPHAISLWRAYRTIGPAHSYGTRHCYRNDGSRKGDFVADIYAIEEGIAGLELVHLHQR